MTESRLARVALRAVTALVMVFVYTPLVLVAIYAFNPAIAQTWRWVVARDSAGGTGERGFNVVSDE